MERDPGSAEQPLDEDREREHQSSDCDRYEIPAPADLLRAPLSPMAKAIYLGLLANCPSPARDVCGSRRELARIAGVDRHTFPRIIPELEDSGWIRTEPVGRYSLRVFLCNPVLAERLTELEQVGRRLGRARYAGEALMKEWLNLLVSSSDYDDNARPGFLKNPTTGENLEYDWWYAVGIAFEFNGPQHYHATQAYPNSQQVDAIRARDYMKIGMSLEHGVVLVTVRPEDLTVERMTALVTDTALLPLRRVRRDDPILEYLTQASNQYIYKATGKWPSKQSPSKAAPIKLSMPPPHR